MIINFKEFESAVGQIERMASDTQGEKKILLNAGAGDIKVCFSDGKKNIIKKLDCTFEEGDFEESAIVILDSLKAVIDMCKCSGILKVDDIKLTFDGRDKLTASVDWYCLTGTSEEDVQKKYCSHIERSIKYIRTDDVKGGTLLTRFNYNSIFEVIDDTADTWEVADFKDVLSRVSKNDPKVCFVSPNKQAAYSLTQATLTLIPLKNNITSGFSLNSKVAKCLSDIVGSTDANNKLLVLTKDKKFCYMMTSDEKLGVMFELTPATRYDSVTVKRFESEDYEQYKLVYLRELLGSIVKASMSAAKDENTELTFKEKAVADGTELVTFMNRGDSSRSISTLEVSSVYSEDNSDNHDMTDIGIKCNLKVMYDLLNSCISPFVKLDMINRDGTMFMRMTDVAKDEDGQEVVTAYHYLTANV